MRKLSQQTLTNAQDVINKVTGGSDEKTPEETPPVESFNLADLIEQHPYQSALGTAALGGLGYAALGGHEGIANKIQGMVDNPLATASGLGAAGVLSKITYDALKEASLKKKADFEGTLIAGNPTTVYRGDLLGNVTGHDVSTQQGVNSLLQRMEKEKKYNTIVGALGGVLTGGAIGAGLGGGSGATVGALTGAGAGALLGYGGSLLEQNITKDMYGISDEFPKPSRTKTSDFRADNAGALFGGIGGSLTGLALGAARGGSKGKMIAGLLGGGLLGSGTGYQIGQAVRGKEDDTGWYGSGDPFAWALGTSGKVESIPQMTTISQTPTPTPSLNPMAHAMSTSAGIGKKDAWEQINELAKLLGEEDTSASTPSINPFSWTTGAGSTSGTPSVNSKLKTKSDDEDNFLNNYGNYLLGASALGGLGYGGYKLHQHLTKEAQYAPLKFNKGIQGSQKLPHPDYAFMAPRFSDRYIPPWTNATFATPDLGYPNILRQIGTDYFPYTGYADPNELGSRTWMAVQMRNGSPYKGDGSEVPDKEEWLKDFKSGGRINLLQTEILKHNLGSLPGAGGTLAGTALGTYLGDRNLRAGAASLLGSLAGGQLGANLGNEFVNYALNNDVDTGTRDLAITGSNLLGQLGGGAAAGYFSREKKADFGEDYYNVQHRPGDVGVPQILGTAGLYGGALGAGAGLATGGISGLIAGLTNPRGQKLWAAAQNAHRFGTPTALAVGGMGALGLGGAMLYKKLQGNPENTDTPEERQEAIDRYNQRLLTPGRSSIRNTKDELMYKILGLGMGKESKHTPNHESPYTGEYNHNELLEGKQKTELPDFLQKEIIDYRSIEKKSYEYGPEVMDSFADRKRESYLKNMSLGGLLGGGVGTGLGGLIGLGTYAATKNPGLAKMLTLVGATGGTLGGLSGGFRNTHNINTNIDAARGSDRAMYEAMYNKLYNGAPEEEHRKYQDLIAANETNRR